MPTSSNKALHQTGFTLLELLVVLSIIAVATGLIVPNLSITDNGAFNAEVRRATSTLTYARRMAIVKGSPQTATLFALDPEASDYEERLEEVNALADEARSGSRGSRAKRRRSNMTRLAPGGKAQRGRKSHVSP